MKDYEDLINKFDSYLSNTFTYVDENLEKLYESMRYSLFSGGKRIRPLLALLTYREFSNDESLENIMPFAVALEMIHTYSLIHDDLPAMDNDDLRRGKPTNHKVFNEACAILAGDCLLNMSMEIINKYMEGLEDIEDLKKAIKAAKYLYTSTGASGMIGGQLLDIELPAENYTKDLCENMYNLKTGALIRASIVIGGVLAGCDSQALTKLKEFGTCIGLSYQYEDDLIDCIGDSNKDEVNILMFMTEEEVREEIEKLSSKAASILEEMETKSDDLKNFCFSLIKRNF